MVTEAAPPSVCAVRANRVSSSTPTTSNEMRVRWRMSPFSLSFLNTLRGAFRSTYLNSIGTMSSLGLLTGLARPLCAIHPAPATVSGLGAWVLERAPSRSCRLDLLFWCFPLPVLTVGAQFGLLVEWLPRLPLVAALDAVVHRDYDRFEGCHGMML